MRIYDDPIDEDDDLFTLAEWAEAVKDGSFNEYDGFGNYVKDGMAAWGTDVFGNDPQDATHVVWYNK